MRNACNLFLTISVIALTVEELFNKLRLIKEKIYISEISIKTFKIGYSVNHEKISKENEREEISQRFCQSKSFKEENTLNDEII